MNPFEQAFIFLKRQMGLYNYDANFPNPFGYGEADQFHATQKKNIPNIMSQGIKAHPNTPNTEGAWMNEEDFEGMTDDEIEGYFNFKEPLAWTTDNKETAKELYGDNVVKVRSGGLTPKITQDEQPNDATYYAYEHDIDPSRLVFE